MGGLLFLLIYFGLGSFFYGIPLFILYKFAFKMKFDSITHTCSMRKPGKIFPIFFCLASLISTLAGSTTFSRSGSDGVTVVLHCLITMPLYVSLIIASGLLVKAEVSEKSI